MRCDHADRIDAAGVLVIDEHARSVGREQQHLARERAALGADDEERCAETAPVPLAGHLAAGRASARSADVGGTWRYDR